MEIIKLNKHFNPKPFIWSKDSSTHTGIKTISDFNFTVTITKIADTKYHLIFKINNSITKITDKDHIIVKTDNSMIQILDDNYTSDTEAGANLNLYFSLGSTKIHSYECINTRIFSKLVDNKFTLKNGYIEFDFDFKEDIFSKKLKIDFHAQNTINAQDARTIMFSQQFDLYNNSEPVISDNDKNLGGKNKAFAINYKVSDKDNDTLSVSEILNGNVLRTLNNAPKDTDITLSLDNDTLYNLPLNAENKITIEVKDNKGGVAYRNYTFARTNSDPVISDKDSDLGVIAKDIIKKYSVLDEEGDEISIVEKIDDIILKTFKVEANKEYDLTIPEDTWIKLNNGKHKLTISATDSNGAVSVRTFSFTKSENKIVINLKKPFITDDKANKILITPVWQNIEKATVKIETCNNGLDGAPTWEDCSKEVLNNSKFTFKNTTKTSEKWGINIKFTIEKKEGVQEEIYFNGFGGAFE